MGVTLTRLEVKEHPMAARASASACAANSNEHRSNCFVQKGINAGWQGDQLVLGPKTVPLKDGSTLKQVRLTLKGAPEGDKCVLTLTADAASTRVPSLEQSRTRSRQMKFSAMSRSRTTSPPVRSVRRGRKAKARRLQQVVDAIGFKMDDGRRGIHRHRRRISLVRSCGRCIR